MMSLSSFKYQTSLISGHRIDGRLLYPGGGYIVMVWRALAKFRGLLHTEMPVMIEHMKLHRAIFLQDSGTHRAS